MWEWLLISAKIIFSNQQDSPQSLNAQYHVQYVLVLIHFANPKGFHADQSKRIHFENFAVVRSGIKIKSTTLTTIWVKDRNTSTHNSQITKIIASLFRENFRVLEHIISLITYLLWQKQWVELVCQKFWSLTQPNHRTFTWHYFS